jgi:hypothetical protein
MVSSKIQIDVQVHGALNEKLLLLIWTHTVEQLLHCTQLPKAGIDCWKNLQQRPLYSLSDFCSFFFFLEGGWFVQIESHYGAQAGYEPVILLPQPSK